MLIIAHTKSGKLCILLSKFFLDKHHSIEFTNTSRCGLNKHVPMGRLCNNESLTVLGTHALCRNNRGNFPNKNNGNEFVFYACAIWNQYTIYDIVIALSIGVGTNNDEM